MTAKSRIWLRRTLIAPVVFFNLQCAALFLWKPAEYSAAYELSGVVGVIVISGFGLFFLMWNVPYLFALVDPDRFRISLYEAILMQTIGVLGESLLLLSLINSGEHPVLANSISRFIWFDGGGWVLLVIAALISMQRFRMKPYKV
jgi:hypothetical protein